MSYNYPLKLQFKVVALAPQIIVTDATGATIAYVKQKLFKLKEAVTVYTDASQTTELFKLSADRIIDFSAKYNFADLAGNDLGGVRRKGARSIWSAHYLIEMPGSDEADIEIQEENAMVKILDACFQSIPVLGMFAGYVFNPTYLAAKLDGSPLVRVSKQPAFFESSFILDKVGAVDETTETRLLLSIIMMTLLERARG